MAEDSKDRFLTILERAGIPVAAVVYCLTTALQLREALDKLGWRIASVVVLLACVAWGAYVWTATRPNLIAPEHLQRRYGTITRCVSIVAIAASCIPSWYVIAHTSPNLPPLLIKVLNRTPAPIELLPYGEAYFSVAATPLSEDNIGSTRLELTPTDHARSLTVMPQRFIWISAHFLNESHTESLLKEEDVALSIMLQTRDHRMLHQEGIPFRRKVLVGKHVEMDLDDQDKP
jgi:hypothetical protein